MANVAFQARPLLYISNTMDLHLAFLGTGTCNATERNPSALALSAGGEVVCVDFGGGAYHQMARLAHTAFSYREISTILLTHFHMDHVSGLPDLFWGEMWDSGGRREKPLTLAGPPGLEEFYRRRLLPFMGNYTIPFEVRLTELSPGQSFEGGFYTARSRHLDHGEFSTAYLIESGDLRLAVTGDTGPCPELVTLMREATHGVLEWSIQEGSSFPGHLCTDDILSLLEDGCLPPQCFACHLYLPPGRSFEEQAAVNRRITWGGGVEFIFPADRDIFRLDSGRWKDVKSYR
ncbi:MAG TPA: MBL fold metallo-hydrolase [Spirochaetes bacterium]|nr:MBL fold metallo-hydrolase [Spirochaetota bacterium]